MLLLLLVLLLLLTLSPLGRASDSAFVFVFDSTAGKPATYVFGDKNNADREDQNQEPKALVRKWVFCVLCFCLFNVMLLKELFLNMMNFFFNLLFVFF